MSITILEVAKARGLKPDNEGGGYSALAFQEVGLQILGGCLSCGATIAAYNAYPTKSGYWRCKDCVEAFEDGYQTVKEFDDGSE